jgi:hypothetical protein
MMTFCSKSTGVGLMLLWGVASSCQKSPPVRSGDQAHQVRAAEAAFRQAKLKADQRMLDRLLADDYHGVNQNGNVRNKRQVLELFKTFRLKSVTAHESAVSVTGTLAMVKGWESETTAATSQMLIYRRQYRRETSGWRLVRNEQRRQDSTPVRCAGGETGEAPAAGGTARCASGPPPNNIARTN